MQLKPTSEGISFDPNDCSDVPDLNTLEHRLKAIAGDRALTCGPASYDSGSTAATNKCVRRAFVEKKAFSAYYVLGGSHVWNVAVGIAGNSSGDLFVITFDDAGPNRAGLGNDIEVLDGGASVVARCPLPIRFGEAFSRNLTCITQSGSLLLSPH